MELEDAAELVGELHEPFDIFVSGDVAVLLLAEEREGGRGADEIDGGGIEVGEEVQAVAEVGSAVAVLVEGGGMSIDRFEGHVAARF